MIVAFDPGVTTGVAYQRGNDVFVDQYAGSHKTFYAMLKSLEPSTLIVERFNYQRRDKVELYPVEVIGILRLYAEQYDAMMIEQTPAQAKNFMTDDKLKKMGLWRAGMPHGHDAARHLMYYLIITKGETKWLNALRPA